MKTIAMNLSLLCIFSTLFLGCSDTPDSRNAQNAVKVESLEALMKKEPKLASASLAQIKESAENYALVSRVNSQMDDVANSFYHSAYGMAPPEAQPQEMLTQHKIDLDPAIAQNAQTLIDEILDSFDMAAQMKAGFKVAGIAINMQAEMLKQFKNSPMLEKDGVALEKEFASDSYKDMTCEKFVESPFPGMAQDQLEEMFSSHQDAIKEALSGCAEIQGKEFVSCIKTLNTVTKVINEHATCSMNGFKELDKIIAKETGKSYKQMKSMSKKCNEFFSKCGYDEKKPLKQDNNL